MSFLYQVDNPATNYSLKKWAGPEEEYRKILNRSSTLYVGNLSFCTTEEQIWEVFSTAGEIKRVIMGLNRNTATPCGFCFVEYFTHQTAQMAVATLNNTYIDGRIIRADWDTGFTEGRQYGRGQSGGQIRDDYRVSYDQDRDRIPVTKSPPPPPPQITRKMSPMLEFSQNVDHRIGRLEEIPNPQLPQANYRESHIPQYYSDRRMDISLNNRGQFNPIPQHYPLNRSPPRYSRHPENHGRRPQGSRMERRNDDYPKKYRDHYEDPPMLMGTVDEFGRDIPSTKRLRH